jgi:hypothetical protein
VANYNGIKAANMESPRIIRSEKLDVPIGPRKVQAMFMVLAAGAERTGEEVADVLNLVARAASIDGAMLLYECELDSYGTMLAAGKPVGEAPSKPDQHPIGLTDAEAGILVTAIHAGSYHGSEFSKLMFIGAIEILRSVLTDNSSMKIANNARRYL